MKIKCGGLSRREGWVNIDKYQLEYTDIICDLDKFPYPFEDNSIEAIECDNVIEHVLYPVDMLKEFERILKKGGTIKVVTSFYNHLDTRLISRSSMKRSTIADLPSLDGNG